MRSVALPVRPLTITLGARKTAKVPVPMRVGTSSITKPGGRQRVGSGILRTRAQIHESQLRISNITLKPGASR
jgi:hypothetical protein